MTVKLASDGQKEKAQLQPASQHGGESLGWGLGEGEGEGKWLGNYGLSAYEVPLTRPQDSKEL